MEQGWAEPEHVVPEKPGQPENGAWISALLIPLGMLYLFTFIAAPWPMLAVTTALVATWFGRRLNHRIRHPLGKRRFKCMWCRRSVRLEIENRWAQFEQWRAEQDA